MAQSLSEIRALLEAHGLSPRHALGQNFLVDQNLVRKLVDASGAGSGDLVLEVGPGTGTLTGELIERGCRVIACELDAGMARLLRSRFTDRLVIEGSGDADPRRTLTLIEGDCLADKHHLSREIDASLRRELTEREARDRVFRLVANLPYGAATPLMLTLLLDYPECRGMYVTIQREVGDRLRAGPGSKAWGPLGVIAQAACGAGGGVGGVGGVRKIATLPPDCFWPQPDVTSVMIGLERPSPEAIAGAGALSQPALRELAGLCEVVFLQRRKQLGAVIGKVAKGQRGLDWKSLEPMGVRPTNRAEELSVAALAALARAWQECVGN